MQLKPKTQGFRESLALATGTLLGLQGSEGLAQSDPFGERVVDSGLLIYSETDRVQVVKASAHSEEEIAEEAYVRVDLLVDSISGATPNGAMPTDSVQTFTTPSGNLYTTEANTTPLREFQDLRLAANLEYQRPSGTDQRRLLGASVSHEMDWTSLAASLNEQWDLNQRRTTLSLGVALTYDEIRPDANLGIPTPLALFNGGETEGTHAERTTVDLLLGWTEVLSRQSLLQLNYTHGVSEGYHTDPYKLVSVYDPATGDLDSYINESRPDGRVRQNLFARWVYHFGRDVLHLSLRHYWDDWAVDADTLQLAYRWQFHPRHYLRPQVRFYQQEAAEFYRHALASDALASTEHISADYRLGSFESLTWGAKYAFSLGREEELSARILQMRQRGESHPATAVGPQQQQDLFPTVEAWIVQFSYRFIW